MSYEEWTALTSHTMIMAKCSELNNVEDIVAVGRFRACRKDVLDR